VYRTGSNCGHWTAVILAIRRFAHSGLTLTGVSERQAGLSSGHGAGWRNPGESVGK